MKNFIFAMLLLLPSYTYAALSPVWIYNGYGSFFNVSTDKGPLRDYSSSSAETRDHYLIGGGYIDHNNQWQGQITATIELFARGNTYVKILAKTIGKAPTNLHTSVEQNYNFVGSFVDNDFIILKLFAGDFLKVTTTGLTEEYAQLLGPRVFVYAMPIPASIFLFASALFGVMSFRIKNQTVST